MKHPLSSYRPSQSAACCGLLAVALAASFFPSQSQAQGVRHTDPNASGRSYYRPQSSGPSAAQLKQQRAQAQAAADRAEKKRESARQEAIVQARIKAEKQERWRQDSKGMMDSFSSGLNGGPITGIPEAPWGFGPSKYDVSSADVGLPPQPNGATYTTSDGEVRSTGFTGGELDYVNNFILNRELSGNPIPTDFFDRDPSVVTRDSMGNPIDSDGFVVEYQSETARQAAIIEARNSAAEFRIRQSQDRAMFKLVEDDGQPRAPELSMGQKLKECAEIINKSDRANGKINGPVLQAFYDKWMSDCAALDKELGQSPGSSGGSNTNGK